MGGTEAFARNFGARQCSLDVVKNGALNTIVQTCCSGLSRCVLFRRSRGVVVTSRASRAAIRGWKKTSLSCTCDVDGAGRGCRVERGRCWLSLCGTSTSVAQRSAAAQRPAGLEGQGRWRRESGGVDVEEVASCRAGGCADADADAKPSKNATVWKDVILLFHPRKAYVQ